MSETTQAAWMQDLQPASWNGMEFQWSSANYTFSKRNVRHIYPYKDLPNIEDLGAAPEEVSYTAFLVGDDFLDQRNNLLNDFKTNKAGVLVDPTLGTLNAKLDTAAFNVDVQRGRVVSMSLSFVLTQAIDASTIGPFIDDDTYGDVYDSADDLDDAADDDFLDDVGDTVTSVVGTATEVVNTAVYAVQAITSTVQLYVNSVLSVVNDASRVAGAVAGIGYAITGDWNAGRYAFGNLTSIPTALLTVPSGLPIPTLLKTATVALVTASANATASITTAANNAATAVTDGASVPTALQSLTETLRTASAPADAIRLLSSLAGFSASSLTSTSPIGLAITGAVNGTASAGRRAALASLARASADYQPSSSNDAADIRTSVVALFDAEIAIASANNDSSTLKALRKLKAAFIRDINKKGSIKPSIVTLNLTQSMPLKVLAYRLYGDASRADEILARNPQIVHPTFSGLRVEVLSS